MRKTAIVVMSALLSVLMGCASVSSYHTLYFSSLDNTKVKVLDWAYADQRMPEEYVKRAAGGGKGSGAISTSLKPVGETFFIKWQVLPGVEVQEARIDLRQKLPWNMDGAELRPTFNNANALELYLSVPDERAPNVTRFRGRTYLKSTILQIYPISRTIDPSGNESVQ